VCPAIYQSSSMREEADQEAQMGARCDDHGSTVVSAHGRRLPVGWAGWPAHPSANGTSQRQRHLPPMPSLRRRMRMLRPRRMKMPSGRSTFSRNGMSRSRSSSCIGVHHALRRGAARCAAACTMLQHRDGSRHCTVHDVGFATGQHVDCAARCNAVRRCMRACCCRLPIWIGALDSPVDGAPCHQ
jgi:hypothetical protein